MSNSPVTPEALVGTIKHLVTLPEVALRITQLVNDPASTAADVAREIGSDAALTARVLRVANSSIFGKAHRISSISRAVTLIGLRQVQDLTVGLTAIRAFDGIPNDLVSMESFWRQSVLCAAAAGHIAARRGASHGEACFVSGLLHDIGQLVIYSRVPELARRGLLMSADSIDNVDVHLCERQLMGFDHGAVGAVLARNWGLPMVLQECIAFHHEPELAQLYPCEVASVHVANTIAVLAEIDSNDLDDGPSISAAALKTLDLDRNQLRDIVQRTREYALDISELFTPHPINDPRRPSS